MSFGKSDNEWVFLAVGGPLIEFFMGAFYQGARVKRLKQLALRRTMKYKHLRRHYSCIVYPGEVMGRG